MSFVPPPPAALVPPAELEPDTFAARVYASLAPLSKQDWALGWSLLILCNAIGTMFQQVEELVRDSAAGPGWSILLDVDRCPAVALPWLGQLAGVRLPAGADEDTQRQLIRSSDGFRRGTRLAITEAVRATLLPPHAVVFRERDGAALGHPTAPDYAYYLTVNTYTSQTPDPAATLAALIAQKPGGLVLNHQVVDGQDWQSLRDGYATWGAVRSAYDDWYGVVTDQP